MDLQFLLPWTSTPTGLGVFVTNLPMFKQVLGDLSPVFFGHFKIVDPSSPITATVRMPVVLHVQRYTVLTSRLSLVHFCRFAHGSDVRH